MYSHFCGIHTRPAGYFGYVAELLLSCSELFITSLSGDDGRKGMGWPGLHFIWYSSAAIESACRGVVASTGVCETEAGVCETEACDGPLEAFPDIFNEHVSYFIVNRWWRGSATMGSGNCRALYAAGQRISHKQMLLVPRQNSAPAIYMLLPYQQSGQSSNSSDLCTF
jgi:hypothetical protein